MTAQKKSTLGAHRPAAPILEAVASIATPTNRPHREKVAVLIRLDESVWRALKHQAVDEGRSIQALAIEAFTLLRKQRGLPPI